MPITIVTDRIAKSLSETQHPQGCLAIVDIPPTGLTDVLASRPQLVVLLADAADPGNAGTVIRTAAAAGADAVVFTRGAVDPYSSKCVRASAGTVLHVPVVVGVELPEAVAQLRASGLQVLATALDGDDLFGLEDVVRRPSAWLFGGEARGLDPATLALADQRVRIPMADDVESLNLAAAVAVCLYASARERTRGSR